MLTTAAEHYRLSQLITRRAVAAARAANGTMAVTTVIRTHQVAQAQASNAAVSAMLTEQRIHVPQILPLSPAAFTTPADSAAAMLEAAGPDAFDRLVASLVQDAGRAAETVAVVDRPRIGYVRHLSPPSCSRCAVLAGRVYRWSNGFLRHPGCDCTMTPTTLENTSLVQDPVSLLRRGLVTGLSKADRSAVLNDGTDITRLVNERQRGLFSPGTVLRRANAPTIEEVLASSESRDDAVQRLADLEYLSKRPTRTGAAGGGSGEPPSTAVAAADAGDEYPAATDGTQVPFRPSERPAFTDLNRRHILDGDVDGNGGHRFGTTAKRRAAGEPIVGQKTEFPESWSDDRIVSAVEDTLNRPDTIRHLGDKYVFDRLIDGETVRVIVRADLVPPQIWTAYPLPKA